MEDFYAKLDTLYLSELINEEYIDIGYFNWQDKLKDLVKAKDVVKED